MGGFSSHSVTQQKTTEIIMAVTSLLLALSVGLVVVNTHSIGITDICQQLLWPNGLYPHPDNCDHFIQCSNNITSQLACPITTWFNPITRRCDAPANVPQCSKKIDVTNACNAYAWGNGIHYHPYDCTKFIECTYGKTDILSCDPGLYFNPALLTCDRPGINPYCGQYITPDPAVVGPLPTQGNYPGGWFNYCSANNLANGIHVDPFSCLHFIECTYGRTSHMECPVGTSFDATLLVCADNNGACKA